MADVGARIYDFFRARGLAPHQAAGILGNTQQESSNNPNAPGGGLIQGQGGRTSSGSLDQQLHGIWRELTGPERGTLAALKRAQNASDAALIFSKRFERPGEPMNEKRVQYANEALKRYGGRAATAAGLNSALGGGGAGEPQPREQQVAAGPDAGQSAALAQMLQTALASGRSQPAVTAPRRPQGAGGAESPAGTPRVPQAPQEAPQHDPTAILSLLSSLAGSAPEAQAQAPEAAPGAPPAGAAAPQQSAGPRGYPLGKVGKVIGLPYQGTHTLGNWESDNAVDIAVPVGTPVVALADGTIGSQIGKLASGGSRFAGERLHLKTAGNEFYYAHLSKLLVKAGQRVKAGQILGYSGEANGVAHLHLGERSGSPVGLTKRR